MNFLNTTGGLSDVFILLPNSVFLNDKTANNGRDIADLFSSYFSSVYRPSVI